MVIFLPDTFVLVAAKDIIKLVYDDVLRCPVPRNIKILTDAWKSKKVGQVNALPLPMACTLKQFARGNKYHFAVRATDTHQRQGIFSDPATIDI